MLDSPGTVDALWRRDTALRHYIKALRAALECYAAQTALPSRGMGGSAGGDSPPVRNNAAQTEEAHAR